MAKNTQPQIEEFSPAEELEVAPESINHSRYIDKAGRVHLVFDPAEIIPDAGTTRTFRGQMSQPKAGNTCSNNGRMWSDIEINGEVYGIGYMVVHRPGGRKAQTLPIRQRPASRRLW